MTSHTEPTGNASKPILVFPGGMPRSLEYLQKCRSEGRAVIGASSLEYDVSREQYPDWAFLPYVTQPGFDEALKQAILKFDIGGIFSPNAVVWDHLNRVLKDVAPGVHLMNDSPVNAELSGYRAARNHASALLNRPLSISADKAIRPPMSEIELAALFRHAELIPGMCDHEKICALCEIARYSATGDIVEIGSWWGKSAFILARLARCYGIGKLLCVDPWTNEGIVSKDANAMVDRAFSQVDAGEALIVFEMNLLPYNSNHVNYLRMLSTDGAKYYREHRRAATPSFGTTDYCGHIAILHIDGNHSYDSAKADIEAWGEFVVDGGWIVFDDYVWPFGDGPQRVSDEFLESNRSRVATAFVMGSALFIQLSTGD
ncbi:MAG: class I SAM-dependent methyltransferase [Nitrosomonadales bacterium]|nr:class I SAM-dependent methyltransferase [Nitrosomonadales bacterium]